MNTYEWMTTTDNAPPLHEDDTREDPGHRPQVPVEDSDTTREHHGNPSGHEEQHEPFRSIEDPAEEVSNEGMVESVRKFFKIHNRGSNYVEIDGNSKANARMLQEQLKNTYASKEWLDQQTHRPGKVKVSDLSAYINFDKVIASVEETAAINTQFQNAQIQAIIINAKILAPIFSAMKPTQPTDKDYDKLKVAVSEMKPITENIRLPNRSKTSLITGKATEESREAMPLEDVQHTAEAITKAMVETHATWQDGADEVERLIPYHLDVQDVIEKGGASKGYNNDAWKELMLQLQRKLFGNGAPEVIAVYRQFEAACVAAITYMERSFKGGKEVVSNEGIFDAIKSIFSKKPKDLEVTYIGTDMEKDFAKTLFDPKWLSGQTFTQGKVSFKFPKAGESGDYMTLCKQVETELNTTAAKNATVVKAYYAKTLPAFAAMDASIVNRKIEEIQKLRDLVDYEEMDFRVKWHQPKFITEQEVDVQFTALDANGVKKAAETILHLLEMLTTYQDTCLENIPDAPKIKWRDLVSQIQDDSKRALIQEYYEDLESINDYGIESFFQNNDVYWFVIENLTSGLMRWISKSVTGIKYSN